MQVLKVGNVGCHLDHAVEAKVECLEANHVVHHIRDGLEDAGEGEKEEDRKKRGRKESTFGTMILMTYIHIQIYTKTGVGRPLPPHNMDGHW